MNWCDTQYHLICHTKWHLYPDTSTKYPLLKWQMDRFPLYVDFYSFLYRGRHGPDRIVVAFTTTYAMMLWVRFSIRVRCTTISGSTGFLYQYNWPSRYITEILLKVSLTTIKQANFIALSDPKNRAYFEFLKHGNYTYEHQGLHQ
jgi:hypothetical protein